MFVRSVPLSLPRGRRAVLEALLTGLSSLELTRIWVTRWTHPVRRVAAAHWWVSLMIPWIRVRMKVPVVRLWRWPVKPTRPTVHLVGVVDMAPRPVHVSPVVGGVLVLPVTRLRPEDTEDDRQEEQRVHQPEADDEAEHLEGDRVRGCVTKGLLELTWKKVKKP